MAVLHMEKYKMSDLGGIQHEDFQRDKDNPNLDPNRTKENGFLTFYPDENRHVKMECRNTVDVKNFSFRKEVKERISSLNLKKAVRKDAVVCASFIVGSDSDFFKKLSKKEQQYFFMKAMWFFGKRYGYRNIICGSVHMDEATPHMHLKIFPSINGKLCAKELFDRNELQNLHRDFHKYMTTKQHEKDIAFDLDECEHNRGKKHQSELAYRCEKMQEQIDQLDKNIAEKTEQLEQIVKLKTTHLDDLNMLIDGLSKLPPEAREEAIMAVKQTLQEGHKTQKSFEDGLKSNIRVKIHEHEIDR